MFLKKLELAGFKSFAKKTIFDFSTGQQPNITAIVGPNGSGKSNVADALRWVMGEQSAKNIRSEKGQDVIFHGSQAKGRVNRAAVSIFLDNSAKRLPLEYEEVVVTRRVYRDGENEYLINGIKVRLMDLLEILAKAGIGKQSYCILNQGMTDRILNASPYQRRLILEEAAGVKEFQIKKDRAERKLKSTTINLEQVRALLREIEPHLGFLKKQYNKAQKGEVYRKQLRQKQEQLFAFLWQGLNKQQENQEKKKQELSVQKEQQEKLVQELEQKIKQESQQSVDAREEVHRLEEQERKLNHQINHLEKRIVVEEGKMELEEGKLDQIKTVEIVPTEVGLIKTKLTDIQAQQDELIEKIEKAEDFSGLKELVQKISGAVRWLLGAVEKGSVERKTPQEKIESQRQDILQRVRAFKRSVELAKEEKEKLTVQVQEVSNRVKELLEKDQKERRDSLDAEDKLRRARFEKEKIQERFSAIEIELAKITTQQSDLRTQIGNELKVAPSELDLPEEETDISKLNQEINRLNFHLEQVGAIDESVIKEYEETQARYDFLQKELVDLESAMEKLQEVISRMKKEIRKRFGESFEFINKEFSKYFSAIFGGGKARLELINVNGNNNSEEDGEEEEKKIKEGLAIIAEPPGKKITNLEMLSGGERALTSIALLFAIVAYNPPPFVFLDEVEAALDESNSQKFAGILGDLAKKTQFVLITHNRQVMKEAGVLYGVSMEQSGVSRLLSMKLDQVKSS